MKAKSMNLSEAKAKCHLAGVELRENSSHHWQVIGGSRNPIVNCWPNGKGGSKISVGSEKAKLGTLDDAINLAGPVEFHSDYEVWKQPRIASVKVITGAKEKTPTWQDDCNAKYRNALLSIIGIASLNGSMQEIREVAMRALTS